MIIRLSLNKPSPTFLLPTDQMRQQVINENLCGIKVFTLFLKLDLERIVIPLNILRKIKIRMALT